MENRAYRGSRSWSMKYTSKIYIIVCILDLGFIETAPYLSGFHLRPVSSMYANNCRNGAHIKLGRFLKYIWWEKSKTSKYNIYFFRKNIFAYKSELIFGLSIIELVYVPILIKIYLLLAKKIQFVYLGGHSIHVP